MPVLGDDGGKPGSPGVSLFLDRSLEDLDGSRVFMGDVREETEDRHRWPARPAALRPLPGGPTDEVDVLVQNLGLTGALCAVDAGWIYLDASGRLATMAWSQAMAWVPSATLDPAVGRFVPGKASVRVTASRPRQQEESAGYVVATVADPIFQPWSALQAKLVKALRDEALDVLRDLPTLALDSQVIAVAVADSSGLFEVHGSIPTLRAEATLLVSGTREQGTGSTGRIRAAMRHSDGSETELALWDPAPDEGAPQWKLVPRVRPGTLVCALQASFEGRTAEVSNLANPDRVRAAVHPAAVGGIGPGGDGVRVGLDDNPGNDNDDDYRIVALAF